MENDLKNKNYSKARISLKCTVLYRISYYHVFLKMVCSSNICLEITINVDAVCYSVVHVIFRFTFILSLVIKRLFIVPKT